MSFHLIETAYAGTSTIGDYNTLLASILTNIGVPLINLMIGVAVLYFLWGVFIFVRNADNAEKRKEGGMHMLFGAIGLFLMVSAWGVLNVIVGTIRPS